MPLYDCHDPDCIPCRVAFRTPKSGECDGCGEDIAPEFLEAATNAPPDYTPEVFRKRETFFYCELCRTEGDEP